jgi:uncharacterized phiE125 gp8 family phage protein
MIPILLTAPATEPISLDEAKAWLRLDAGDEDQLIAALIVSARMTLEAYTRRFFVTQSWRMTLDAWPAATARRKTLSLPFAPFQSVSAIRVLDEAGVAQTLDAESYRAPAAPDRGRIVFDEAPEAPGRANDGIEIDLVAGYGAAPTATPEPLRRAILALVAHWHENRGDAPAPTARLPALAAALASPFRRERLT